MIQARLMAQLFCLSWVMVFGLAVPVAMGAGEVTPEDALAGVTREVLRDVNYTARNSAEATAKAEAQVRKNLLRREGALTLKVERVEKEASGYRIRGQSEQIRWDGVRVQVGRSVLLSPGQEAKALKLKPGDTVKAAGRVSGAMMGTLPTAWLYLNLLNATLQ